MPKKNDAVDLLLNQATLLEVSGSTWISISALGKLDREITSDFLVAVDWHICI